MPIDTDLLKRTMTAVELADERGEWNQGAWRTETDCGTAYCFAGWVAKLEGREWIDGFYIRVTPEESRQLEESPDIYDLFDDELHVGAWAEWRMGLSEAQAANLLHAENTLDDLRRKVNQLCALAEDGL